MNIVITITTNRADAESMNRLAAAWHDAGRDAGDWAKIIQGVTNLLGNPDNAISLELEKSKKGCK